MISTRRRFIRSSFFLSAGALTLIGCDDDYDAYPSTPDAGTAALLAIIQGNHGHVLVVTNSDLREGLTKTYEIMGSSGHSHTVTLTAAQFEIIRDYGSLSVQSTTTSDHSHSIMLVY